MPNVSFTGPVHMAWMGETEYLVVCEQFGKIWAVPFPGPADVSHGSATSDQILIADFSETWPLLADVANQEEFKIATFSIATGPNFASDRWLYVCYLVQRKQGSELVKGGTHVSRFKVDFDEAGHPKLVLNSEQEIFRCDAGGHNGCTLLFGPNDGYLYISIGDLADPTPPDTYQTGQDISDNHASIARIDVNGTSDYGNYGIPDDNPFLHLPHAAPEVYAYGLRNPWRMSFDRLTGDLWVGDIGWEAWEMIYRVVPGGNYGWSIKEGPGDVNPEANIGPTPILPPDLSLPHTEAASITGGFVYRGQNSLLSGHYVFGDWITRRFWKAKVENDTLGPPQLIAESNVKPLSFLPDREGEVLVLDYVDGWNKSGIYRLVEDTSQDDIGGLSDFPESISESGLFQNLKTLEPSKGVTEFSIASPMWNNGAITRFHLAIPDALKATFFEHPQKTTDWFRSKVLFPVGTVLVRTTELPRELVPHHDTLPPDASGYKIETQIRHLLSENQWKYYSYQWRDDQSDADLVPPEGSVTRLSVIDESRTASGHRETEIEWKFASRSQCRICHSPWSGESLALDMPQIRSRFGNDTLSRLISAGFADFQGDWDNLGNTMVPPHESLASLDDRARSYLHANCAHCHIYGNGSVVMETVFSKPLETLHLVNEKPMKGDFGLDDAAIVRPGVPSSSVLLYRMLKAGSGQMPHMHTPVKDVAGCLLIADWIEHLETVSHDELSAWPPHNEENSVSEVMQKVIGRYRNADQDPIGELNFDHSAIPIRELVEPLLPPHLRTKKLGADFDDKEILEIEGDPDRGKRLFMSGAGQCSQCHQLEGFGKPLGPNLAELDPQRRGRQELLKSIRYPSREIEQAYQTVNVLTLDGEVLVGFIEHSTEQSLTIRSSAGESVEIDRANVDEISANPTSLMPEGLLDAMTAEDVADLLAYLAG